MEGGDHTIAEKTNAEGHKKESLSSVATGDDADFVPRFLNRKSRTESVLQAVRSVVGNRFQSPIEDRHVTPHRRSNQNPYFAHDHSAHRTISDIILGHSHKQLLRCITGANTVSSTRTTCENWYLTYLDARVAQTWLSVTSKVLPGVEAHVAATHIRTKVHVYEVLFVLAKSLEKDHECSFTEMAKVLQSKGLIKDDADPLAVQLVFQYVGWLTALYDPLPDPSTTHLSLRKPKDKARRRKLVQKTVVRQLSVVISGADRPIQQLLRRFGSLLPEAECVRGSQQAPGLEAGSECIIAAYISFQSLQQMLNIRLEWVDVLNQHLEFDQRKRVLRVFKLPSICRLMYREEEGTLLNRLFREDEKERDEGTRSPHYHSADIEDFLVEVILSYRLIFGRDRRSRARIGRLLEREKRGWQDEGLCDPLLQILCTKSDQSPEIQELYADLEAKEFEGYISVEDFPFLARRLFDLQRFSMAQNPHSWRRLWSDQRNITAWFTIWAVVIIGGLTTLFQVLQFVFQVYQPLNNNST